MDLLLSALKGLPDFGMSVRFLLELVVSPRSPCAILLSFLLFLVAHNYFMSTTVVVNVISFLICCSESAFLSYLYFYCFYFSLEVLWIFFFPHSKDCRTSGGC